MLNTRRHQPTDACNDYHCHSHNIDEPKEGYRLCLECGHCFTNAAELTAADYNWQRTGHRQGWTSQEPQHRNAENIHSCPHCTHDF